MSDTLALTTQLIRCASVTPDDEGCQQAIAERLSRAGFEAHHLQFGEVSNLWLCHGTQAPLFVFLGHTDVVPTGPLDDWQSPPFEPTIRDAKLYGRGAADMKGSVAAMVVSSERFVRRFPQHRGSIALLVTSDEEGPAVDGTVRVIDWLSERGQRIDWCLVGEPSSVDQLGDMVKIGRRGSLGGRLLVRGVQGHVAYPHRADNPVHRFAPALAELVATRWDDGNEHFPATTFQVSNVMAGTGATNVVPGSMEVQFNFRYSTQSDATSLQTRLFEVLERHGIRYEVEWESGALPFLTSTGDLVQATRDAIAKVTGLNTVCSTEGGTSDGRFVAPTGAQVVELGPTNASIHQIDEHVAVSELDQLTEIYADILETLLG